MAKVVTNNQHLQKAILLLLEEGRTKDGARRNEIKEEISKLQKMINVKKIDSFIAFSPLDMEVFASLGLRKNPNRQQIGEILPRKNQIDVDKSISKLLSTKLIRHLGEGRYTYTQPSFAFPRLESDDAQRYIENCIIDGHNALKLRGRDERTRYFDAIVVSVKRERFLKKIDELRKYIEEFVSDIESEDADCLVRINVQSYLVE